MKRVLVRHSFDLWEEWEDEYATKDHVEFAHNEACGCADNVVHDLLKRKRHEKDFGCFCHLHSAEVLEIQ